MAMMLARGWAVAVTDYQGLGTPGDHAYMVGPGARPQRARLDARRARSCPEELPADGPAAIIGYSEGGAAAAWAAQLQPTYAPEIELCGVVAGAAAADVETAGPSLDGTFFSFFIAYGGIGYAAAYPELELDPYLTPMAREGIEALRAVERAPGGAVRAPLHARLRPDPAQRAGDARVARAGCARTGSGASPPRRRCCCTTPGATRSSPSSRASKLREDWERLGADVRLYVTRGGVDHISGAVAGTPVALDWLARRLAPAPRPSRRWRRSSRRRPEAPPGPRQPGTRAPSRRAARARARLAPGRGRSDPRDRAEQLRPHRGRPQVHGLERAVRDQPHEHRARPLAARGRGSRCTASLSSRAGSAPANGPSAWRASSNGRRARARARASRGAQGAPEGVDVLRATNASNAAAASSPRPRSHRRGGAEVEDRDAAVGEHEHVVGIRVGVDDPRAGAPSANSTSRAAAASRSCAVGQRHAVDPFADEHGLVRQRGHRGRNSEQGVAAQRAMEAAQRPPLALEVELVEHALADLGSSDAAIQGGERRGQRSREGLEQGQVLADEAGETRTQHLDRHRRAVVHAAMHLGGRRDRHRLGIELVELAVGLARPRRRAGPVRHRVSRDRLARGLARRPRARRGSLAPRLRDPGRVDRARPAGPARSARSAPSRPGAARSPPGRRDGRPRRSPRAGSGDGALEACLWRCEAARRRTRLPGDLVTGRGAHARSA